MTRPKRILVVDDDELIRTMFKLAAKGFNVIMDFAPTSVDARRLIQENEYDYAFLDMKLEMAVSGMDVLRYINASAHDINVVIMSGSISLSDIMHEASTLGVLAFIQKPVSFTLAYLTGVFKKLGFRPGGPGDEQLNADVAQPGRAPV